MWGRLSNWGCARKRWRAVTAARRVKVPKYPPLAAREMATPTMRRMLARHPNLRYRRGDAWLDCYLRGRMIAQGSAFKDGRWMLARIEALGLSWRTSQHPSYDAMLAELVPWARAYAWKHDHKPLGNPTCKGLRRRPDMDMRESPTDREPG